MFATGHHQECAGFQSCGSRCREGRQRVSCGRPRCSCCATVDDKDRRALSSCDLTARWRRDTFSVAQTAKLCSLLGCAAKVLGMIGDTLDTAAGSAAGMASQMAGTAIETAAAAANGAAVAQALPGDMREGTRQVAQLHQQLLSATSDEESHLISLIVLQQACPLPVLAGAWISSDPPALSMCRSACCP